MAWTNFVVRAGDDTSTRPWAIHGGRIVTGYLDGHCESVTPKELRFEGNDHGNASGDMKYYTPGLLMMNAYISAEGVKVDLM
jgi:prepilin-type processing-associated H-X9-DG protein